MGQLKTVGEYAYDAIDGSGKAQEQFLKGTGLLADPVFHTLEFAQWRAELTKMFVAESAKSPSDQLDHIESTLHWSANRQEVERARQALNDGNEIVADAMIRADVSAAALRGCPPLQERRTVEDMASLADGFTDATTGKRYADGTVLPDRKPNPQPGSEAPKKVTYLLAATVANKSSAKKVLDLEKPYLDKVTAAARARCSELTGK